MDYIHLMRGIHLLRCGVRNHTEKDFPDGVPYLRNVLFWSTGQWTIY